jgi:hypothetical protein
MLRLRACQRGAASVEHAALVLLAGALAITAVAGARLVGEEGHRPELASALLRKQRCAVRHPDPCWQDPLTEAYGRRIAGAVRALAPAPELREGLVGVDYRRCRQPGCAIPSDDELQVTTSNRRSTAFTAIREQADGAVAIDYWIYRPTVGWQQVSERAERGEIESLAPTPLLDSASPVLVPLETLLGRDEARFRAGEEPPWRGEIESRWGR